MAVNVGGGRRIGAPKRPARLSVVLTPSRRVLDGEPVDVVMGDGRVFSNCYSRRLDDGSIRVELPAEAK